MSSLYQLISNIKKRPSMYLGKPAISNLSSFLSGYIFARRELDQPQTEEEKEFSGFQTWVKSKYGISSDQSWEAVILFYSEDENSALTSFFKLFDEFLSSSALATPSMKRIPVGAPSIRKSNLDTSVESNVPNENTSFQSTTNG